MIEREEAISIANRFISKRGGKKFSFISAHLLDGRWNVYNAPPIPAGAVQDGGEVCVSVNADSGKVRRL